PRPSRSSLALHDALPIFLYPVMQRYNVPLMGLFIGQLPVFLLGMAFAKHGFRTNVWVLFACIACLALGQRLELFFTTTFIAISYLMIVAFFALKRIPGMSRTPIPLLLNALGGISMAVFILNGPLRTMSIFRDGA